MEAQQPVIASATVTKQSKVDLVGTRLFAGHFLSLEEERALETAGWLSRTVGPNVDLIREGERTDRLFVVTDGWACRYTTTKQGRRQLPAVLVPGDVANLDVLMLDRLDYGVRTVSPSTVVSLRRDRAMALAAQHAGIARTFTWLAFVENAALCRLTQCLGRRCATERLAHFLCELSVRVGAEENGSSSFAFPLTQEYIADALGLTPVHVNRTMQHLRNEGLVQTGNRTLTLPDVARLRRIGGFDPRYLH